jgi:hypothetical protein
MLQLRLHDPSFTPELVSFLRRCQCQVRDLGPAIVGVGVRHAVDPEAAVRPLRSGICCRCGSLIADALLRLGSLHCHDCRESSHLNGGTDTQRLHDEWARMEIEAYLRVWRVLHPGAEVELVV